MTESKSNSHGEHYDPLSLEPQMRQFWRDVSVDATGQNGEDRQRRYVLGMFPYPSGKAHMGHVLVYSLSDAVARMGRFKGLRVLHPLGWDAFGLPAENAAIQNNVRPDVWTALNIERMREQLDLLGFSFDRDREINSCSPDFYRWTQFLFLKLHEAGLVYRANSWVNWDPVDKTVLANEQVIDGKGWRSGAVIERRLMEQWYIRITAFAEDLWNGLDQLDGWSDRAISAQRNWIGRSEGANIRFGLEGHEDSIEVFTSRPETLLGVAAIVVSPEHPLIERLCVPERRTVIDRYVNVSLLKAEVERQAMDQATGEALGAFAVHPLTSQRVPIFVGDYVIGSYGTGAVMCVPAHDTRDFDFARAMGFPIKQVIRPADGSDAPMPFLDMGVVFNSGAYDGLDVPRARKKIVEDLQVAERGCATVNFRLRDWSISRQRIWGCPIPMEEDANGQWHPAPYDELPVLLPLSDSYEPGAAVKRERQQALSGRLREVDTMDTFMCSAWYAWRFIDPHNDRAPWSEAAAQEWLPIDYYVGGLEHANQHLIYFRFMSHFLHSIGMTPTKEPVTNFLDNGLIRLGGFKMSKSKGNVVAPEDIVSKYGADALRLYVLSDAPFERDKEWDDEGLQAKHKFLRHLWGFFKSLTPAGEPASPVDVHSMLDEWGLSLIAGLYKTANEFESAIDRTRSFNVAVSLVHGAYNSISRARDDAGTTSRATALTYAAGEYLKLLGVFCPHIAESLWQHLYPDADSLFVQRWVAVDPQVVLRSATSVEVAVTVNGKLRANGRLKRDASDLEMQQHAYAALDLQFAHWRSAGEPVRTIYVRDHSGAPKVVNVVVRPN